MKQVIKQSFLWQALYQLFTKFMRDYFETDLLVDIFTLSKTQVCKRQEKGRIERDMVKSIRSNFGIYCAQCKKDLNRIIFFYYQQKYYCPNCFELEKNPKGYLCVFVDQLPSTQLSSSEVSIQNISPKQAQVKELIKPESEIILNEKEKKMFDSLRDDFFMGNTDLIDFIAGELHQDSNENEKAFIAKQIYYLSKQRQQNYKRMKKFVRKYEQKRLSSQYFFSQDQDSSINELGQPLIPLEQLSLVSKKIVEDIDSLTKKNDGVQDKPSINQVSKPNKKYNIK